MKKVYIWTISGKKVANFAVFSINIFLKNIEQKKKIIRLKKYHLSEKFIFWQLVGTFREIVVFMQNENRAF